MSGARMRTVQQTVTYFKQMDTNTAVNETMLRRLLKEKKIKFIKVGAKYLINLDSFEEFLKNPPEDVEVTTPVNEYGKLRRIEG